MTNKAAHISAGSQFIGHSLPFGGYTYIEKRDGARLGAQLQGVFDLMKDGRHRTLAEIAKATGYPEASISARLRNLRDERFGGHTVNKVFIVRGLFRYQLVLNETAEA